MAYAPPRSRLVEAATILTQGAGAGRTTASSVDDSLAGSDEPHAVSVRIDVMTAGSAAITREMRFVFMG